MLNFVTYHTLGPPENAFLAPTEAPRAPRLGLDTGGEERRLSAVTVFAVPPGATAVAPIPSSRGHPPAAAALPLQHRRAQSKRLRRDAANPKLHALDVDLDEDRVGAVGLAREIDVIGVLPSPAD